VPQSSHGGSVHLPSPFGHGSISLPKPHDEPMPFIEDDVLFPFEDIGLEVDADGNIVQVAQELELPHLLMPSASVQQQPGQAPIEESSHHQSLLDDQEDIVMNLEDSILPMAASFSPRQQAAGAVKGEFEVPSPPQRRRGRKVIAEDDATRISRDDFQSWSTNYLRNMAAAHKPTLAVTAYKARQNAKHLVFGLGLASIGLPISIPGAAHPLADIFAGAALRRSILGPDADQEQEEQRGQRRSPSEAFGDEEGRRVRPRLDDDGQEFGRAGDDDQMILPGDDLPEVGREPASALSDRLSPAPWNRPPSATRGSSVHSKTGLGALPSTGRLGSSPLVGRGTSIADIVRLSDNATGDPESDGFQPLFESSFLSSDHRAPFDNISGTEASQAMRDALDREGKNFLLFVGGVAAERGISHTPEDEKTNCRWVDFKDLFEHGDNTKATAARAFFHVLTLVTCGAMKVEQDEEDMQPFGNIRLGVKPLPRFLAEEEQDTGDGGDEQTRPQPQDLVQGVETGISHKYSQSRDGMSDIYDA
jgi:meiotic recombination protein REC8, fungi type